MIKIEKLSTNTKATIERNGAGRINLYLGMILNNTEFATLELVEGSVIYSIDELEVKTITKEPNVTTAISAASPAPIPVPTSNSNAGGVVNVATVVDVPANTEKNTPPVAITVAVTPKKAGKTVK